MRLVWILMFLTMFSHSASAIVKVDNNSSKEIGDPAYEKFQKIYYFQHRLLPQLIFKKSSLYEALTANRLDKFLEFVGEVVDKEYAKEIKVEYIASKSAVLLTFSTPTKEPLCYFVFIRKIGDNFQYFTYEKTFDLMNEGYIGVVGGWEGETHLNFGSRKYKDSKSFIEDIPTSSK